MPSRYRETEELFKLAHNYHPTTPAPPTHNAKGSTNCSDACKSSSVQTKYDATVD